MGIVDEMVKSETEVIVSKTEQKTTVGWSKKKRMDRLATSNPDGKLGKEKYQMASIKHRQKSRNNICQSSTNKKNQSRCTAYVKTSF